MMYKMLYLIEHPYRETGLLAKLLHKDNYDNTCKVEYINTVDEGLAEWVPQKWLTPYAVNKEKLTKL